MKVFLDDVRDAPEGWTRARWPDEVIALLESGVVEELSLDHDLGDDERGTGYTVVAWIEEAVAIRGFRAPAVLVIHSANAVGRQRMAAAIASIRRLEAKRSEAAGSDPQRSDGSLGSGDVRRQR